MSAALATDALADGCALAIRDAFADYHARFAQITRRARGHFEQRDWPAARADAVARIALYDRCVQEISQALEGHLGARAQERGLWSGIRDRYAALVAPLLDQELYKTFFNTLTRRFFRTQGVAADIEFVALEIEPTDRITIPVARHSYAVSSELAASFARVLGDFPFAPGYADLAGDASALAAAWRERTDNADADPVLALELLQTVFYRERRAYLVGRIFQRERYMPCVIVLVNGAEGVRVGALLLTRHHVAVLFGYAHSYFHADLPTVGDAVVFLRTLLPGKPLDEIYTVLGRAKQGKTERYRHFFRHLQAHPGECLRAADGERGMVMAVFTLPSYPLVFKVIRDEFGFPKQSDREEVRGKYSLVFHHDRVGRLIDAQEYRHLRFPRVQFEPALLRELLDGCRLSVSAEGQDIVVHHCYVERRLRPLNLYVRESTDEVALAAILDYGQAIKDLARSNIFPGDLLFKNFGATRHGRAVFYDYDELCLVTQCRFRVLPEPRNDEEEMHHGAWYHVADADVFPEQFPRFLGMTPAQREALLAAHGEIFQVGWWQALQAQLRAGELVDVPPYPEALRVPGPTPMHVLA
ncbi:MAG: bifunctional isocitrate dehydrogenase kinase/phosphatase [Arenimonas sp.]